MRNKNCLFLGPAFVAVLLNGALADTQIFFEETFDNPGSDAGLNVVDWHANYGSTATVFSEMNTDLYDGPIVSSADFIIYQFNSGSPVVGGPVLIWTDEMTFCSLNDISEIGVSLYNSSSSVDLKIALKVSGSWYVSQTVLNGGTTGFVEQSVEVRGVSWNSLSFVSGTTLSEGGAVNLPFSGMIEAVGVFDANHASGHRVRIDDFTLSSSVAAGVVLNIDFTSGEGFADGVGLDGIQGMDAQQYWVATNTAEAGYAICNGIWERARNTTNISIQIDGAVQIDTVVRLSPSNGVSEDVFYFGFAVDTEPVSQDTPSIGSKFHTNTDGSYWFGSATSSSQRISIASADANDWIKFTQIITRSSASNEFVGIVSASNITDGVDLGTTEMAWLQTATDGSWGGEVNASFRRLGTTNTTLELDSWVVRLIDPPDYVTVNVDVSRHRCIDGVTALDRETWFGIYHETGFGAKIVDGKSMDEWIDDEGGMWPSRGTMGYKQFSEDPLRPSYIDPDSIGSYTGKLARYVIAEELCPDHKTIFSGLGQGDYPDFMCYPTNLTKGVNTVSNHVAHGEAVVLMFERLQELGGLLPQWYEVMNESSIPQNFGWFWDADAWEKLADFHVGVADAMHASVFSNSVKIAGPVDAWPFRDGSDGDFSPWEDHQGFIQATGDKLDAYAIHAYEKTSKKTCYEDMLERYENWHHGRLPAFIDLWENEHLMTWSNTLPFVFSEYGLIGQPKEDTDAFWQTRSFNGILLSMLDRPDIIDKMSIFIATYAPYNFADQRVMFASEDNGSTYYKTDYFEYLRFWHDLEGDYLFSKTDSRYLGCHAFLADSTNLYVVLLNNYKDPYFVDLQTVLPAGASVGSVQMQKLHHENSTLVLDCFVAVSDSHKIYIGPDEAMMLKVALGSMSPLPVWHELNFYGDRTLVTMSAQQQEAFGVDLPEGFAATNTEGVVHVGLYAYEGFSNGLQQVSVNGTSLTGLPDLSDTAGAPRYWTQLSLPVPEGVLQDGSNTVVVIPSEGDPLMKITSVRISASSPAEVSEVFSESFYNSGSDAGINTVGWHANYGASGTAFSETNTDLSVGPVVSSSDYIIYQLNSSFSGDPVLIWTGVDLGAISHLTEINCSFNNSHTNVDFKVALQVDGEWYVSQNVLNGVNFAEQSLEVQTASWNSLTFVSGTSLDEGSATNLPHVGSVTAIGLFDSGNSTGHRVRFDDFTVFAYSTYSSSGERQSSNEVAIGDVGVLVSAQMLLPSEAVEAEGVVVSWEASDGFVYDIYYTSSLSNPFELLRHDIAFPQASYTDTVHRANDAGFYKIYKRSD